MPSGNSCSVAVCSSQSYKIKESGETVRFFRFPKEPKLRKIWILKCRRKDTFNPVNGRICSRHFTENDYEDAIKARLLNIHPKILKKTAVPSLYLLPTKDKLQSRSEVKEKAEETHCLLFPYPSMPTEKVFIEDLNIVEAVPESRLVHQSEKKIPAETILVQKNTELLQLIERLEDDLRKVHQSNVNLQKENKRLLSNFEEQAKMLFSKCLSSNQIDIILKKKTKVKWTEDEFSKAFTLRQLSQRSYTYLKDTLNYPLPGPSTLRRWVASKNILRMQQTEHLTEGTI